MAVEEPIVLYKYWNIAGKGMDYFEEMLATNSIMFSAPSAFNDPFDCAVQYDVRNSRAEVVARYVRYLIKKGIEELDAIATAENDVPTSQDDLERWQEERVKNIVRGVSKSGVLCLTTAPNNPLMWTHYANYHSGICIGFHVRDIQNEEQIGFIGEAHAIQYSIQMPLINVTRDDGHDIVRKALFTKAIPYSYEQEWRIVRYDNSSGLKPIPIGIVGRVVLGVRIDEPTRERVIRACKAYEGDVEILKAELDPLPYGLILKRVAIV